MSKSSPSDACLDRLGLRPGETLWRRPLAVADELADWRLEGPGVFGFPRGRLRLESAAAAEAGQAANLVLWCPQEVPDRVRISWDFWPLYEPGLAICFFAARGRDGRHVLDPGLAPRSGPYQQYHSGDIDAYHVSYFRRRNPDEIRFHTCNLRKSHGFHLVCQGADPIPGVAGARGPYRLAVVKDGPRIAFCIDDLLVFAWHDDGALGPPLGPGCIGFRQMAPLIAEYAELRVDALS